MSAAILPVTLSGVTFRCLRDQTGWGTDADGGSPEDRSARTVIMHAPRVRMGFGWQYRPDLTLPEAEALRGYLDGLASTQEEMDEEDREGDHSYRSVRKDVDRLDGLISQSQSTTER